MSKVCELNDEERDRLKKEIQDRDARELLRQKIDNAQRKKLKLRKGKMIGPGPPREMKYLPAHAFETADGDPLRALTAAVSVLTTTK